jgi:hypothetical protein
MKKYPFNILVVKIDDVYHGRVVFQGDNPLSNLMFSNQRDEQKHVAVSICDCFEFAVNNNGGTLFLRGADSFADHVPVRINRNDCYIKDLVVSLNKSFKEHYENQTT